MLAQYHGEHMNSSAFMFVQFDMKLIHYTDAPDQLFNLTADPDELIPITLPYLSNRMLSSEYN